MSVNAKIALRSLVRNKGRVFTRIISLTLGLALGVTLLSYVNYRFNYDNFLPDYDRIYKIFTNVQKDGGGVDEHTHAPLAHSLMRDCPAVEYGTRMYGPATYNWTDEQDKEHSLTAYSVDTLFFKVLDFGLVTGDPSKLNEFGHIFISEEAAKRLFGNEDPIGKVLKDNLNYSKDIVGIFKEIPYNTSLGHFDLLLSDNTYYHNYDFETCWDGTTDFFSYVKLRQGGSAKDVEEWMNGGMLDKYGLREVIEKYQATFMMVPVTKAEVTVGNRRQYMDFIAVLAILVLALCALNYALLAISSLVNRSKAIAVMRCTAADKKDIRAQFLWETFFVMLIASVLSVLAIYFLRNYLASTIDGPIMGLFNPKNIWVTILVVLALFFGAGMIPATIFASVPTTVAFRGISDKKKGWKQCLLVFEIICVSFASAFLLVSVRQISLLQNGQLGYNPKNLAYVNFMIQGGDALFNAERDIEALPFVDKVGTAYDLPINGIMPTTPCIDDKTGEVMFPFAQDFVSYSYFDVMEMTFLEGHPLTESSSSDDVVVNRRFLEMAGMQENPLERIICEGNGEGEIVRRLRIVGVVEDVRLTDGRINPIVYKSIKERIANTEYFYGGFRTMVRMTEINQDNLDKLMEKYHEYDSMDKYMLTLYEDTFNNRMKGEFNFRNLLLIIFVLTTIITAIGLVGYISDDLKRRRREIALRRTFGAKMTDVFLLVIREFSALAVPSVLFGEILAVIGARRWLQMFEYRLPLDWWMFVLTGILILAVIYLIEIILTLIIASANPAESFKTE